MVATLLSSLSVRSGSLGTAIADEVAVAIASHEYELTASQLPGALELSLESSHAVGAELRERVLATPGALTDVRVCVGIVKAAEAMFEKHLDALATAAGRLAREEPDSFVEALSAFSDDDASRVLTVSSRAISTMEADKDDAEEAGAERGRMVACLDGILALNRRRIAEEYAAVLLRGSLGGFTNLLTERFDRLAPTTTRLLSQRMTAELPRYPHISYAREWLDAVTLTLIDDVADAVSKKLGSWATFEWGKTVEESREVGPMKKFAEGLKRYSEAGLVTGTSAELEEAAGTALEAPFSDADELTRKEELADLGRAFATVGLVSPDIVSDSVLKSIVATLAGAQSPAGYASQQPPVAELGPHVAALAKKVIPNASAEALDEMRTMAGTVWDGERQAMSMMAAAQLEDVEEPYELVELAELVSNHMPAFALGLQSWLDDFDPDAASIVEVLRPVAAAELHPEVQAALRAKADQLTGSQEHLELVTKVIESAMSQPVTNSFYRAIRLRDAAAQAVAQRIVELYEANPDQAHVRELLKAWTELGPTDPSAQRPLLTGFFIPAAKGGDASVFNLLIDNLGLLRGVPGDRRAAARDALRATAEGLGRSEELEGRLEDEGFKTSSGFLRGPKDV